MDYIKHGSLYVPSSYKQSAESWYLDDDDDVGTDSENIDRYLARQRIIQQSDAPASQATGWISATGERKSWDLSSAERKKLQKQCHILYFKNPFAGNIIDNYSYFTCGNPGLQVSWQDKNASNWWEMIEKRCNWTWLSKDIITLTYITGECFVILFPLGTQQEKLDLLEVHPTEIVDIKTSKDDRREIESYQRGQAITLTATEYLPEDVIHFKIRDVGGVPRGRPILERVLQPLALYDDWLLSRADLNRMRSRLPVIRYRSGLKRAGLKIRSLPEPGTVIDAHKDAEEWVFPSLTIQAADAATDGEAIKQYIASGVSLPEFLVTGSGSTAEIIGSAPVILFENFQSLFKMFFTELISKVMPAHFMKEPPAISFPEVDLQDLSRKRIAILNEYRAGIRSKYSTQLALGLLPEEEAKFMQEEIGLTKEMTESIPENLLNKFVSAILFYAPAIRNGRLDNPFLDQMTKVYEERGWI